MFIDGRVRRVFSRTFEGVGTRRWWICLRIPLVDCRRRTRRNVYTTECLYQDWVNPKHTLVGEVGDHEKGTEHGLLVVVPDPRDPWFWAEKNQNQCPFRSSDSSKPEGSHWTLSS